MRTIILIVGLLIVYWNCYAQNDTIYLEKEYIKLNDKIFNQINSKGEKIGDWIEYGLTEEVYNIEIVHWDGDTSAGMETINYKYRPLEDGEHCGISIPISKGIDTIKSYSECVYNVIINKIPKQKYYIKASGHYIDGHKDGKWNYLHENGVTKKVIHYSKGIPNQDFQLFAKDKSLMMEFRKIRDNEWEIIKYTKEGLIKEIMKLEEFKTIYE
ncbi:hypothetical protein [Carboxylicivirga linearis]|uniref:Uncharacterized protein n=1 Tax=Carboxylicivirga linearis TaxID=1628157 RepID=A0ABS5K206_9BACT|nr:hypothetical protein [Carboxylicivirga linearis]MBS2101182.1 hypothetical protein [Carboxylicivirga linearis]